MIIKLTEAYVANSLQCPPGKKRAEVCDDGTGMYIELRSVSPGQGTYYLRYKDSKGKTCHQRIGKTTEISLTDARKQAKTLKAEIELGADPRGEEKARLEVITMDDFFNDHYLPYVKPRKRSWKRDRQLQARISIAYGSMRLNQLTRMQVQKLHSSLLDEGLAPASANHHIKLIRRMLNLAIEWGMLEKNVASRIPMFLEPSRTDYLGKEELQRLMSALRTDDNHVVCSIVAYLLLTGVRLNTGLKAMWRDIDIENRVWRIPAEISKGKKVFSVPLNDSAIEILEAQPTKGKHEYVFVNQRSDKPYTTIRKTFERLKKKADLPDSFTGHGLRHTFASMLANSGRTLYEIQILLHHSSPSVTQKYAHLSSKSMQEASNSASIIIQEAMKVKTQEEAKVA